VGRVRGEDTGGAGIAAAQPVAARTRAQKTKLAMSWICHGFGVRIATRINAALTATNPVFISVCSPSTESNATL